MEDRIFQFLLNVVKIRFWCRLKITGTIKFQVCDSAANFVDATLKFKRIRSCSLYETDTIAIINALFRIYAGDF